MFVKEGKEKKLKNVNLRKKEREKVRGTIKVIKIVEFV